MEKIDPRTTDITQENIERLIELFPSVATETYHRQADGSWKLTSFAYTHIMPENHTFRFLSEWRELCGVGLALSPQCVRALSSPRTANKLPT